MIYYHIIADESGIKHLTAFSKKYSKWVSADSTHPRYNEIEELVKNDYEEFADLIDMTEAVAGEFKRITDKVTIDSAGVKYDLDPIDESLSKQIMRFYYDSLDYNPLVKFLEKVMTNTDENSRNQLFTWLSVHDFTINDAGNIIGYKSIQNNGDGSYTPYNQGFARINDQEFNGRLKISVGDTVEMPRSMVTNDPAIGCSVGHHVGTFAYAHSFGPSGDTMMLVEVDPADVVSVPDDCNCEKMRVSKYKVLAAKPKQEQEQLTPLYNDWSSNV